MLSRPLLNHTRKNFTCELQKTKTDPAFRIRWNYGHNLLNFRQYPGNLGFLGGIAAGFKESEMVVEGGLDSGFNMAS